MFGKAVKFILIDVRAVNLISLFEEIFAKMAADKTGCSGNKNFHSKRNDSRELTLTVPNVGNAPHVNSL